MKKKLSSIATLLMVVFFYSCDQEEGGLNGEFGKFSTINEAKARFESDKVSMLKEQTPNWETYRFSNFIYSGVAGSSFPSEYAVSSGWVGPEDLPLAVAEVTRNNGGTVLKFKGLLAINDTALYDFTSQEQGTYLKTNFPANILDKPSNSTGTLTMITASGPQAYYTIEYSTERFNSTFSYPSVIGVAEYPFGDPFGVETDYSFQELSPSNPDWLRPDQMEASRTLQEFGQGQVLATDSGNYYFYPGVVTVPTEVSNEFESRMAVFSRSLDENDKNGISFLLPGSALPSKDDFHILNASLRIIGNKVVVLATDIENTSSIWVGTTNGSAQLVIQEKEKRLDYQQGYAGTNAVYFLFNAEQDNVLKVDGSGAYSWQTIQGPIRQGQFAVYKNQLYAYVNSQGKSGIYKAAENGSIVVGEQDFLQSPVSQFYFVGNYDDKLYAYISNDISPGYSGRTSQWIGLEVIEFSE